MGDIVNFCVCLGLLTRGFEDIILSLVRRMKVMKEGGWGCVADSSIGGPLTQGELQEGCLFFGITNVWRWLRLRLEVFLFLVVLEIVRMELFGAFQEFTVQC